MQWDFDASLKIFSMDPLRRNFLINVWDVLVSFLFMLWTSSKHHYCWNILNSIQHRHRFHMFSVLNEFFSVSGRHFDKSVQILFHIHTYSVELRYNLYCIYSISSRYIFCEFLRIRFSKMWNIVSFRTWHFFMRVNGITQCSLPPCCRPLVSSIILWSINKQPKSVVLHILLSAVQRIE